MLYKDEPTFPLDDFYLARASANFAELLAQQAQQVYEQAGLAFPVATTSTFDLIAEREPVSIAAAARALGRSHQSTSQQVKTLLAAGLLAVRKSDQDARARLYELTPVGRRQHKLLTQTKAPIAAAYGALFTDIGVDLSATLERATAALSDTPISERIKEGLT